MLLLEFPDVFGLGDVALDYCGGWRLVDVLVDRSDAWYLDHLCYAGHTS